MLRRFLYQLKQGTEHLNFGRDIISDWSVQYAHKAGLEEIKILDIGCGQGADLSNIKNALSNKEVRLQLSGIECYEPYIQENQSQGIQIYAINIEQEKIPAPDEFFDIVIANQIIEHTKDIFWIFSEISRVLKKGGIAIIGVPNLASLHNRLALLGGEQPTAIELLGPHVRGFTKPALVRFVTCDDYFNVLEVKGSNLYPFPPALSRPLSRFFPTLAVSLFILLERTYKEGKFIEVLDSRFYQTAYFKG